MKLFYLKVFGCISYVHIDFNNCSELDAKSTNVYSLLATSMSRWAFAFGMNKIKNSSRIAM